MSELSLELSKRLDELGVKVESKYVWFNNRTVMKKSELLPNSTIFPAPTFEELWAVMPKMHPEKFAILYLTKPFDDIHEAGYLQPEPWTLFNLHRASTPTEALGLLAIWLAENGHLKGE